MNSQETVAKALDILLNDAAELAAQQIEQDIFEPEEEIAFSKEHEEKMQTLFRKERRRLQMKKCIKYAKRAACILVALAVLSGVTMFSVEAWRVKFLNFVFHDDAPNTDFHFSSPDTSFKNDEVTMGYVPEGFVLVQDYSIPSSLGLVFAKDEEYFNVSISDLDSNFSIDTENGTIEPIKINGCEGYYTSNPNINSVIWYDQEYVFTILGNISKEELVHIAQKIKI